MPSADCFKPLAITHTSQGAAATPRAEVMSKAQKSRVAARSISRRVASLPCCARLAASTGTKAWLKAPSANRRRNRLGMRNATLKASVSALAPKVDAINNSRARPVMREARVSKETIEADLKRLTLGV